MRTMLLSFKPNVYDKILYGEKIFEHRKRFPDEPIIAYMYISKPVKAISGICYLNNRHLLSDWEKTFANDSAALSRIQRYKNLYTYAMEITEFQETEKIHLSDLKNHFPDFIVPQSYYYLDNRPLLLKYIQENTIFKGKIIKNNFSKIEASSICIN